MSTVNNLNIFVIVTCKIDYFYSTFIQLLLTEKCWYTMVVPWYINTVVFEQNLRLLPVPVGRLPVTGMVLQVTGTV